MSNSIISCIAIYLGIGALIAVYFREQIHKIGHGAWDAWLVTLLLFLWPLAVGNGLWKVYQTQRERRNYYNAAKAAKDDYDEWSKGL